MNEQSVTGVLLLNLGGPATQEDVEPFLYNLFSDRSIIRLGPCFMQKFIAHRIARKRAPESMANYRKIGGGSPILEITDRQARALEDSLKEEGAFRVRPCMRYWHPFASEALEEMAGVNRLIALPLYPHYSIATSGSSLADLRQAVAQSPLAGLQLREVRSWPTQPEYITALAERIKRGCADFDSHEVQVVYSAHSLPKKFITEGDPYVREIEQTIAAVEEQTGIRGRLCYQSRSGPVEWLEPSTPDMLKQLAKEGCRNILMVPISFVSDHIETLYEIDMLYRETAEKLGMRLMSTPGLNDDPRFIRGLKELVMAAL